MNKRELEQWLRDLQRHKINVSREWKAALAEEDLASDNLLVDPNYSAAMLATAAKKKSAQLEEEEELTAREIAITLNQLHRLRKEHLTSEEAAKRHQLAVLNGFLIRGFFPKIEPDLE